MEVRETLQAVLAYLKEMVALLSRGQDLDSAETALEDLEDLSAEFQSIKEGKRTYQHFTAKLVGYVVAFSCVGYLQDALTQFIGSIFNDHQAKSMTTHDLKELLDFLKKKWNSDEMKKVRRNSKVKINIGNVCSKLMTLRNNFAHSNETSNDLIRESLQAAVLLLRALGLGKSNARFVIDSLEEMSFLALQHPQDTRAFNAMVHCSWARDVLGAPEAGCDRRSILLSRDKVFVGRGKEMLACKTFLLEQTSKETNGLIVVKGLSGVGKTAFARNLMGVVEDDIRQQLWLCAPTSEILLDELEIHLAGGNRRRKVGREKMTAERYLNLLGALNQHVIVIDDLTSESAGFAASIMRATKHLFIITMQYGRTDDVERIAKHFSAQLRIELPCLRTKESLQLLKERGIAVDKNSMELLTGVLKQLKNLPLALNLFSRTVNWSITGKMTGDQKFGVLKRICQNLKGELLPLKENQLLESDPFHVRGFEGIITLAAKHIAKDPATFCMMAIVCLLSSPGTPWELFENGDDLFGYETTSACDSAKWQATACLESAFNSLFGVRKDFREAAKETLLELGLVSWDWSNRRLVMHDLVSFHIQNTILSNPAWYPEWLAGLDVDVTLRTSEFIIGRVVDMFFAPRSFRSAFSPEYRLWQTFLRLLWRGMQSKHSRLPPFAEWTVSVALFAISYFESRSQPVNFIDQEIMKIMYTAGQGLADHFGKVGALFVRAAWRALLTLTPKNPVFAHTLWLGVFGQALFLGRWPDLTRIVYDSKPPQHFFDFLATPAMARDMSISFHTEGDVGSLRLLEEIFLTTKSKGIGVECVDYNALVKKINKFLIPGVVLHDQLSLHVFLDFARKARTANLRRLKQLPSMDFMDLLQIEVKCSVWLEKFETVFDIIKSCMAFLLVPNVQKLELCLIGAICLCLLGRFEEARSLAKDVLSILQTEITTRPMNTPLQCITLRLLAYLALHEGNLNESLGFLHQTFSLDVSMAAGLRNLNALFRTNLIKGLVFFVQWQESIQAAVFLEIFLWKEMEEDAPLGVMFKPHYAFAVLTHTLREIYLEKLSGTSSRKCRLVARLGRLYRLGHSLLDAGQVAKSKECFKEWLRVWTTMCKEETLAIGTPPPWLLDGQVVLTIGVHVLQTLGKICEEEGNFDQARWCYLQIASVHDCLYLNSHQRRTKNQQDVKRVERMLQPMPTDN